MEIKFLTKQEFESIIPDFINLYQSCFNGYIDENILKHRFLNNPYEDLLMCVAFEEGKLIANYSVSPTRLSVGCNMIKSALSLNTMTHPDYSGRGLFVTLAEVLYAYIQEEGYELVYGFPNYLSNPTFYNQLSWVTIYEHPTLELDLTNETFSRIKKLSLKYSTDTLFNEHKDFIEVYKSQKYINWRYLDNVEYKYFEIRLDNENWCIYKFYNEIVNIVEFHVNNSRALFSLILEIIMIAQNNGKNKLTIWSKINTEIHYFFEKMCFRNKYPVTYFAARILSNNLDKDMITDSRLWRVSMGDDNVY